MVSNGKFTTPFSIFGSIVLNFMFVVILMVFSTAIIIQFTDPNLLNDIRQRAASPSTTTTPSSVTLNQPSPTFGQSVNFTAVYPKDATRKLGPRQHENPYVQVDCYQAGTHVYMQLFSFNTETNNGDGTLTGVTYFYNLGPFGSNGMTWTSGGATCNANLYYYGHDSLIHVLASQTFEVSP